METCKNDIAYIDITSLFMVTFTSRSWSTRVEVVDLPPSRSLESRVEEDASQSISVGVGSCQ